VFAIDQNGSGFEVSTNQIGFIRSGNSTFLGTTDDTKWHGPEPVSEKPLEKAVLRHFDVRVVRIDGFDRYSDKVRPVPEKYWHRLGLHINLGQDGRFQIASDSLKSSYLIYC
jgi:hypothetical protein